MKHRILCIAMALMAIACGNKNNPSGEDTEAPAVPSGVQLKSNTETSLVFAWSAVSGADTYQWRLLQGMTEVKSGKNSETEVTVTGLTAGTSYSFSVRTIGKGGMSAFSSAVSATTASSSVTPPDPTPDTGDIAYADFMIPENEEDGVARAFPGAEGGGMYTTGGRGGKVIHVTNLRDSGEGSLRAALNEKGARTIVFDVAGIIELQSSIQVKNGDVTVAGQTSPGDGICIKNYTINIAADNVIIRFVRFRLGDEGPNAGDSEDCIWGRYQNDIILDHCSMSWSIDECASFYANANMTLQWCILAESMQSSVHSKGNHGYGGIWGGKNASFHHNLLAHHQNRTPRFDHQYLYDGNGKSTEIYRGNVDYRNCVNYNWGTSNGCYGGEGGHYNMVNNYYKKGPNSNDKKYFIEADGGYSTSVKEGDQTVTKYFDYDWPYLYLSGNYNYDYPDGDAAYPDGIYWKKAYGDYNKSYEGHVSSSAFSIKGKDGKDAYTTTHSAADALEAVCNWAGASLKRDAVDERICKDVKSKTGRLINNMDDVRSAYSAAWPTYSGETVSSFPDWVGDPNAYTIDPQKRYTNLEMYLHYLVKDIVNGGNQKAEYKKL
ncbi:MAG: fibronectin type III domain-containing protein [Candidatus Cryptobacteroides sp.]|nr:fibronectin type III domain-containing protein [Candidatus Cryptobacteroides sp.]